jgi:hypothetical protein
MNLSDIFYEAAIRMSDGKSSFYSCAAVEEVSPSVDPNGYGAMNDYAMLMKPDGSLDLHTLHVRAAAKSVRWGLREYRTFMLLMASEAAK